MFWVVFVWGASAAFGAVLGPLQARVVPRLAETRQWLTAHWDLAPRYLAEGTLNSAAAQLVTYGIGLLLGLAAVGAVQAASLLMGPYMVDALGYRPGADARGGQDPPEVAAAPASTCASWPASRSPCSRPSGESGS